MNQIRTKIKTTATAAFKEPAHNNPQKRIADLTKACAAFKSEIDLLRNNEAERASLQEEYNRIVSSFSDVATADAETSTLSQDTRLVVEWLELQRKECRRARVIIPNQWDDPVLFAKGDEQIGHIACDDARVQKDIEWAAKNPHCLVVLLGDGIDSATKESPGYIRENKTTPLQQVKDYIALHKPIASQIIGYVGGNHERRIDKALSDPGMTVSLIAEGLSTDKHKIPYSGGLLLLDLHWRGHLWTVTLFHGAGAAQTAGSKIQRMQRNMLLTDSLITLSGHLHDEAKTSRRFLRRMNDGSIKVVKQTALQCGTYIKYIGSYGEIGGMAPTGPDMIVIEFKSDGKYVDRFKGESDF
jgi:predicted phosphodiesterase